MAIGRKSRARFDFFPGVFASYFEYAHDLMEKKSQEFLCLDRRESDLYHLLMEYTWTRLRNYKHKLGKSKYAMILLRFEKA